MYNRERLGPAYDAVATDYDDRVIGDTWIRRILWRHFARVFGPGDRLMDAGCGTGIDSIHLASRGMRVTAIDNSPKMIGRLRAKIAGTPYEREIDVRVGSIVDVAASLEGPFDGLISSFAALNTVDLEAFARIVSALVRPGGRIICHLLAPGYVSQLARWAGLLRGPRPEPGRAAVRAIAVGGQSLDHLSLPADQVYRRFFQTRFSLREQYGLGLLLKEAVGRLLADPVADLLGRVDRAVGAVPPLVSAGRFFVLDLERRSSP